MHRNVKRSRNGKMMIRSEPILKYGCDVCNWPAAAPYERTSDFQIPVARDGTLNGQHQQLASASPMHLLLGAVSGWRFAIGCHLYQSWRRDRRFLCLASRSELNQFDGLSARCRGWNAAREFYEVAIKVAKSAQSSWGVPIEDGLPVPPWPWNQ